MNAQISAKIIALLETGMTLQQAFDAVIGPGAYSAIAATVYAALGAR